MRHPGLDDDKPSSDPRRVAAAVLGDAGKIQPFDQGRRSRAEAGELEQSLKPEIHARRGETRVVRHALRPTRLLLIRVDQDGELGKSDRGQERCRMTNH